MLEPESQESSCADPVPASLAEFIQYIHSVWLPAHGFIVTSPCVFTSDLDCTITVQFYRASESPEES